jgi:eukaryotic-like serine/threonine-protein kinase
MSTRSGQTDSALLRKAGDPATAPFSAAANGHAPQDHAPRQNNGHGDSIEADDIPDDPRLLEAVQEFLAELEAGKRPNRQLFLKRYPDIAQPLAECLAGLDLVHKAALSTGSQVPPATALRDETPRDPLGDFQIEREIGRGGMGIVYEATQLSLGRRVALKVLPFAATLDAKHLQRFRNEATAAAQLHHTNIVPVYAVGCERGVHYYAMQLIDGQSLAAIIDQVRERTPQPRAKTASVPRVPRTQVDAPSGGEAAPGRSAVNRGPVLETLSPFSAALSTQRLSRHLEFFRAAANLVRQAADAVEHAHQCGIVHRDIKPANLLVDAHGRLWITDFGVAQFHAQAGLTQTGDMVGTLRYMSPEQAAGQRVLLDHRTDIYALGATLYELTTLQPIFSGQTRAELLNQILHQEPRAPRAVDPTVPVELETIILKAVSKAPGDRYNSAREFAADLQRYLDDQPILAKRPTLVDRVRKWSRRHPALVAAAVLVLVLCVAGLVVNSAMIATEQAKTKAALTSEMQRAAEARRAVDLLVQVSEEELADFPHLQSTRRRLLETALTYYQNFIETHGNDPAAQAELAAGKSRVRNLLDELATLQGARLVQLAMDGAVQKDLGLSEEQRTELADLNEHWSEQRITHFKGLVKAEQRRQKFYELAKEQEAALSDILQPEQVRRLRQIGIQVQGPRAFSESPVTEVLKLTAEQRQQIRTFRDEAVAAMFGERSGPERFGEKGPREKGPSDPPGEKGDRGPKKGGPDRGGPDRGPGGPGRLHDFERIQKAELERIVAILTPEQQGRWNELIGAPFTAGPRPHKGPRGPFAPR